MISQSFLQRAETKALNPQRSQRDLRLLFNANQPARRMVISFFHLLPAAVLSFLCGCTFACLQWCWWSWLCCESSRLPLCWVDASLFTAIHVGVVRCCLWLPERGKLEHSSEPSAEIPGLTRTWWETGLLLGRSFTSCRHDLVCLLSSSPVNTFSIY